MAIFAPPVLTIAVPVWNKNETGHLLSMKALRSIRDFTDTPYKLVVVDNDSPFYREDKNAAFDFRREVASHQDSILSINKTNQGFGPAVNRASKYAHTRYFAQMNSDCELVEDTFGILIDQMVTHHLSVAMPEHYENCRHYNMHKTGELMGPDWRFGALWVSLSEAFHQVGGFDERYELCYFEDTDLWKRLEARGHRISGYRGTWVKHVGGASALPNRDELFEKNRRIYEATHG